MIADFNDDFATNINKKTNIFSMLDTYCNNTVLKTPIHNNRDTLMTAAFPLCYNLLCVRRFTKNVGRQTSIDSQ